MAGAHQRGHRSRDCDQRPASVSLLRGSGWRIGVGGRESRHRSACVRRSAAPTLSGQQRGDRRPCLRPWIPLGHRRHDRTAAPHRRADRSAPPSTSRQPSHRHSGIARNRRGERNTPADDGNARSRTPGAPRRARSGLAQHNRPRRRPPAVGHGPVAVAARPRNLRPAVRLSSRQRRNAAAGARERALARVIGRAHLDDPDPHRSALLATVEPNRHARRRPRLAAPSALARARTRGPRGRRPAGRRWPQRLPTRPDQRRVRHSPTSRGAADHDPPPRSRPPRTPGAALLLRVTGRGLPPRLAAIRTPCRPPGRTTSPTTKAGAWQFSDPTPATEANGARASTGSSST